MDFRSTPACNKQLPNNIHVKLYKKKRSSKNEKKKEIFFYYILLLLFFFLIFLLFFLFFLFVCSYWNAANLLYVCCELSCFIYI